MTRAPDLGPLGTGRLTKLDEQVLAAIARPRGRRLAAIARDVPAGIAEVRSVLRGFEHLGRATGRGGWWRAL